MRYHRTNHNGSAEPRARLNTYVRSRIPSRFKESMQLDTWKGQKAVRPPFYEVEKRSVPKCQHHALVLFMC
jgi:hypothetical protein